MSCQFCTPLWQADLPGAKFRALRPAPTCGDGCYARARRVTGEGCTAHSHPAAVPAQRPSAHAAASMDVPPGESWSWGCVSG